MAAVAVNISEAKNNFSIVFSLLCQLEAAHNHAEMKGSSKTTLHNLLTIADSARVKMCARGTRRQFI
jgi:hypothetical protein